MITRRRLGDAWRRTLRRRVLEVLQASGERSASDAVIMLVITDEMFSASEDQLRGELEWLQDQGLITVTDHGDVWTCQLTRRGSQVATGRADTVGVADYLPPA